ncbi:hypothetical protein Ahy_A08g040919 isoform C [Arachis hypogaea]|uniref:Uncharacterized protein n=1 Tax=Arachis hypogaea TaxID=3818 RepID=A0A445C121_ARAHY|nr:hypothetical protein Ahy_A08g040919 isoform C [Arachis hypogaea]
MMQRRSPPKHRHDGTSPLPLGMDWSPAPRKWNGRDTVWPHNHRTGWSYCVTIPSWVFIPKSKNSDPIVVKLINNSFLIHGQIYLLFVRPFSFVLVRTKSI